MSGRYGDAVGRTQGRHPVGIGKRWATRRELFIYHKAVLQALSEREARKTPRKALRRPTLTDGSFFGLFGVPRICAALASTTKGP